MVDLHNHSEFSPDSTEKTEDMIAKAKSLKVDYFGISEHADFFFQGGKPFCDGDYSGYIKKAEQLKLGEIGTNTLLGLEIGFDRRVPDSEFLKIERAAEFDYVICSVHLVDGGDCYFSESFSGRDQRQFYTRYLETVADSLDAPFQYEIVGHIGYISRNAPYADPAIHYADYADILDRILKRIIEKNKTIELNTSSRTAGSIYLPSEEILARYRELGGRNITFGSDAHTVARICDKYAETAASVKKLGFTKYDVFCKRRRIKVDI